MSAVWRRRVGVLLLWVASIAGVGGWIWAGVVSRTDPDSDPAAFAVWFLFTVLGLFFTGLALLDKGGDR